MKEGISICVVFCLQSVTAHFPIQVQEKKKQVGEVQSPGASPSHELESGQDPKGWLEWPSEHLGKDNDIILLF